MSYAPSETKRFPLLTVTNQQSFGGGRKDDKKEDTDDANDDDDDGDDGIHPIATENIATAKSSGHHHHAGDYDYDIDFSHDSHFHLLSLLICNPHFSQFETDSTQGTRIPNWW